MQLSDACVYHMPKLDSNASDMQLLQLTFFFLIGIHPMQG